MASDDEIEYTEELTLANNKGEGLSLKEIYDMHFPYYLIYGMTYEQFWQQDVELARHYREAYRLRKELQMDEINYQAWLQGRYYFEAIQVSTEVITKSMSGKKGNKTIKSKYPDKPFETKKQKEKPIDNEEQTNRLVKFLEEFEKKHKKKQTVLTNGRVHNPNEDNTLPKVR